MNILTEKPSSERLFRILFQVLFWIIWIGYPFINADYDNPSSVRFIIMLFWVRIIEIPLFYFNLYYLIPKVFRVKGIATYLIILILLCSAFIFMEDKIKFIINPEYKRSFTFFIFFPALFVAAVSTGYGLVTELQRQERDRQDERQERLQSELSFLRSQISPHFIFNVLNSIVYLIRTNSPSAESITIQLAELIRYMLYEADDKQVTLSKELDYLNNYISLQKIRYGEDVPVKLTITGTEGSQLIEPMLLIPFVENAFKHGVGMAKNPRIDITINFDQNKLDFEVENTIGGGESADKDSSSGIGLKNVTRRLELLYPDSHKLDVNERNNLFVVNLTLDFKK